jgi:hypothetical protein
MQRHQRPGVTAVHFATLFDATVQTSALARYLGLHTQQYATIGITFGEVSQIAATQPLVYNGDSDAMPITRYYSA